MTTSLRIERVAWNAGGRRILTDVTCTIQGGEVVAIMGLNGAGKSTLLDIVAGLRMASAGSVTINDRQVSQWSARERARLVAHLPQTVRPDLPFLAAELVLMGRYPHTDRWFETTEDRHAVALAMQRTQSWELRDRPLATLSGGERQRVLLAACLAQSADIMLMDEPSTHLDIDQQMHCFALLREESARGAACVAVTHDLNLALAYATRLIVLAGGQVARDIAVEDAGRSPDWLSLFSPRLTMVTNASGRPWVSYS